MSNYVETLTDLGLTPNEAKIYEALLSLKRGSIWDISTHAGIHRRNAYDAIQRLLDRGLAYQVLPKKTLTYAPVHPDKLNELIEDKVRNLEQALPGLRLRFEKVDAPQSIYVYKGVAGLKNYINLIIKEGQDIYGIGSKGTWFDERIRTFAVRAGNKLTKLGIKTTLIYDPSLREHPEVMKIIGAPYKFLPEKYATESSIDIFGDYVAMYSGVSTKGLDDNIIIFIMRDKTLATDTKKWFDFMWDHLPEEN
ncbi:MAG: hypothetical protein KBC35_01590 [Candidatus Pacebacteria bacterium]|nr:hypothetical protein [Candidatus Paceibacterota bacterium]